MVLALPMELAAAVAALLAPPLTSASGSSLLRSGFGPRQPSRRR